MARRSAKLKLVEPAVAPDPRTVPVEVIESMLRECVAAAPKTVMVLYETDGTSPPVLLCYPNTPGVRGGLLEVAQAIVWEGEAEE